MKKLLDLYFKHVECFFGKNSYSRDMYELSFLSQLNSWAIQFKPTINYNSEKIPFSMSSIILAQSGSGKDASIRFLDPVGEQAKKSIDNLYKIRYSTLKEELEKKEEVELGTFTAKSSLSGSREKAKYNMISSFDKFNPEPVFWSKSATREGLSSMFAASSVLACSSVGIESSELADHFASDREFKGLLEMIAEFYNDTSPSSLKITLGRGVDIAKNVQSSIRLHGSPDKFMKTPKLLEDFQVFLRSSLARRSLFFKLSQEEHDISRLAKIKHKKDIIRIKKENIEKNGEFVIENNLDTKYMFELKDIICRSSIHKYANFFIKNSILQDDYTFKHLDFEFNLNSQADLCLAEYSLKCSELANKYIQNGTTFSVKCADEIESRYLKALRVAALSSFYKFDNKRVIDVDDVEYAISVVEKSGEHYKEISKPTIIADNVCKILEKFNEKMTVKQLEEFEAIPLGMQKPRLNDLFDRCKELMYERNNIFRRSEVNIPQVWIEKLKETEQEIAHITYSTEEAMSDTNMEAISIPIYDILKIPNVKKISQGGFTNNHRCIDNVLELGNVFIYDVDDGDKLSIRQAIDRLSGLCGIIYPTKNNNKPKEINIKTKDGTKKIIKKCERYRIILLSKYSFLYGENKKVAEEEFKEIYDMVAKHYGIPYDPACKDISRFVWIPEEAKTDIVIKKGRLSEPGEGVKIDIRYFIKDLKLHHELNNKANLFNSTKYWKSIGVKKILEQCIKNSIITGNRNTSLLIMALSLKDVGLGFDEIKEYVYDVDSKFPNGSINDEAGNEIEMTILSTLKKRMIKEEIYPNGLNKINKIKNSEIGNFSI